MKTNKGGKVGRTRSPARVPGQLPKDSNRAAAARNGQFELSVRRRWRRSVSNSFGSQRIFLARNLWRSTSQGPLHRLRASWQKLLQFISFVLDADKCKSTAKLWRNQLRQLATVGLIDPPGGPFKLIKPR